MRAFACVLLVFTISCGFARAAERVVDIPTRPGVTQRFLLISPPDAKAAVIVFAGGQGGLQMDSSGIPGRLKNNFLVRSAPLFAAQQLVVAVIDAPSDRQSPPHLLGFRNTGEHAADVKAVIAWLRQETKLPVWLVGTSRGTQSAASAAARLARPEGPNGIVLTSTILVDKRDTPVPDMALDRVVIPGSWCTMNRTNAARRCFATSRGS